MTQVDVVLPVRNGAKYLHESISSLLLDWQSISTVIIVNDGSTDDTEKIISSIEAKIPIKVIYQEPAGIVAALNRGIAEAQAEYIARMDADDISLKGRLPAQIAFLQKNQDIAVVGTQAAYIDENGALTGKTTKNPTAPAQIYDDLRVRGSVICHPSVVFRRTMLSACGGYRFEFPFAEDFDLFLRLSEQFNVANLDDSFLHYRIHADQVSETKTARQSLSRDLALLCALERRSIGSDSKLLASIRNDNCVIPPSSRLAHLLTAHQAKLDLHIGNGQRLSNNTLQLISSLCRLGFLGQDRGSRIALLNKVSLLQAERLDLVGAAETLIGALVHRVKYSRLGRTLLRQLRRRGRRCPQ